MGRWGGGELVGRWRGEGCGILMGFVTYSCIFLYLLIFFSRCLVWRLSLAVEIYLYGAGQFSFILDRNFKRYFRKTTHN